MRRAFSLLELLVVIAILAVLVGLLLTAVQRARDAAARNRSLNQLRQIGLATQNYESAHPGHLPGTGLSSHDGEFVVFYDILPYLEQESLYRQFPRDGVKVLVPPTGGPRTAVKTYLSTADASNPTSLSGNGWACASFTPNPGFFQEGKGFNAITDGASNTIAFAERIMTCGSVDNMWFHAQPDGLLFGAFPPATNFGPRPADCDPDRVASAHPGLILVALGDGSTRSFSYETAAKSWVAACDPADGKGIEE